MMGSCRSLVCILAVSLLKEDIPHTTRGRAAVADDQDLGSGERMFIGGWRRLKAHLADRLTWTGMFYLFLKFQVGIATFVIAVTLVSVSIALIAAPAYMWTSDPITWGSWTFDPFPYSWILPFLGVPALFVSFHLMNAAALVSGKLTRVMLGRLT